ncbi:acetate uptake transporter [Chitinibacter sp. GC72]|uniref:acetate uptake transporter n=1 Tax=Chitinibacter sp. GC72 TaxID=1526917 RepID=UPI0018DEFB64|nr:acetate uptake transporter [Chitinibacter sp. GC72]
MSAATTLTLQDQSANPAPLGLMGFGMTTVLLNLHNAGLFELNAMILAMGIFYGGLAQVIAGVLESKKNNTFGMTAFTSYGMFWLTLVALIVFPQWGIAPKASESAMGWYLLMWGIFTAFLFVGTLRMNFITQFIFGSLTLLFALLAIGDFTGSAAIKTIAGYEGIICGAAAIYSAMGQILNEIYGREVLPLGGSSH